MLGGALLVHHTTCAGAGVLLESIIVGFEEVVLGRFSQSKRSCWCLPAVRQLFFSCITTIIIGNI